MRVEFEFDEQKIEELGFSLQDAADTLIAAFEKKGLPCVSDQGTISFEGAGNKNDFSNMWLTMVGFFNADWFLKCATACRFYDDSPAAQRGAYEDVLSQAALLIRKKGSNV